MTISCGAALLDARLAMLTMGHRPDVRILAGAAHDSPGCLWRLTYAVVGRVAWAGCGERAANEGWSVLLSGRPEIINDHRKVRWLERHPLAALARAPHRRFVRVAAEEITGHVMPLSAGGA